MFHTLPFSITVSSGREGRLNSGGREIASSMDSALTSMEFGARGRQNSERLRRTRSAGLILETHLDARAHG